MSGSLKTLLVDVRACQLCAKELPLGTWLIVRMVESARILIIGKAPGTNVHASGVPRDDPSGDRLRDWLRTQKKTFHEESRIAIMPMRFSDPRRRDCCGDKPSWSECALQWQVRLLTALPNIELTLSVGSYARKYYLYDKRYKKITETVRHWKDYSFAFIPTPHSSWRTMER